ncbi:MAG: FAS1-like dehydratase domain-containing protein [Sulfobacillus sp.]
MEIPPVGATSSPLSHDIEVGAIRRFAQALGLTYAPFYDTAAAQAAGYRDVVAPPTFVITLNGALIPGLALPDAGLIHGEQSFRYGVPVVAHDVITVVSTLIDVKSRGPLTFLTVETKGSNQHQEEAFVSESTIIAREEILP